MYIGVDIGGTKCAVVLADAEGNVVKKEKFATTDFESTFSEILENVRKMGEADAIGISCGGPLDSGKGIIMSPPNLPGWDNVRIKDIFEEKFKIKTFLQNDANACAVAEWKFGAGKGCKNMVFLTFGTGLGAGLILNGRLYDGTNGMAGEVGHIRLSKDGPEGFGKKGSFEGFCSGGGIRQLGEMKAESLRKEGKKASFDTGVGEISAKTIAEFAQKGCEDAMDVYRLCGSYLGKGLAVIIDILNPEKIVIGSIYARSEHLLRDEMLKTLKEEGLFASVNACDVVPAALGDEIGDRAAVAVAMSGFNGEI